jgi:WD40 repeat protein
MKEISCLIFLVVFVSACSGAQESIFSPTPEPIKITLTPPASLLTPSLQAMTPANTPVSLVTPSLPVMTPTNAPPSYPIEPVTFTTTDDNTLAGTLFGEGEIAVILAHQGTPGADQKTWHPFARLLAERGFAALAFDFRGVGQSEGRLHYSDLATDVDGAVQFLQSRGYTQIACAGASMGGTACIRSAQDQPFIGLIILASTMLAGNSGDTLALSRADLATLMIPKLFVVAESENPIVVDDMKYMTELSPPPKKIVLLPGWQHGTYLFTAASGEELTASLLEFLEGLKQFSTSPNPNTPLPPLEAITTANAGNIQLLKTLSIPDFKKGSLSQCSVAFSPDSRLIVGACGKNQVPVWDAQTGLLVHALYDAPVQIVACAFSPDGKQITCGGFDKAVMLWDAITGYKIEGYEGHTASIWDITFQPDGNSLTSCSLGLLGGGRGDVRLWNMLDKNPRWVYSGTRDCLSLAFHPSGKSIAYGSIGGSVGILDVESGELLVELTDSSHNIGGIGYSRSGSWLAAGSDDRQIYIWDTSVYKLAAQLEGHAGYVNGVAFNPDETLLVSGSHDKTVGVWNLTDQKLITQLKGHEGEVLRVAFSPDGTLIASISWDGTVRIWGISR